MGITMQGLVPDLLAGNTKHLYYIPQVNTMAAKLKKDMGCDKVICLSHLGYKYKKAEKIADAVVASETDNIDLIIDGHTLTFLDEPALLKNKSSSDILVNQVGWAGIMQGSLDFEFTRLKYKNMLQSHTVVVVKKTNE